MDRKLELRHLFHSLRLFCFFFFFFFLPLLFFSSSCSSVSSSTLPDRYLRSIPASLRQNVSQEYFELTLPLPTDGFTPSCSLIVLQEDFGDTIGSPPATAVYSPPIDCPGPWSYVILEVRASCKGEQYDRIAGVWLGGVEILRTSTAEPTESGIFWKVRKDVTRYASLLAQSDLTLSVMLENIVNDNLTGVYHVNVSLLYYGGKEDGISDGVTDGKVNRKLGFLTEITADQSANDGKLGSTKEIFGVASVGKSGVNLGLVAEEFERESGFISKQPGGGLKTRENSGYFDGKKPADLIIPISDAGDTGHWFRIQNENDVRSKEIQIPRNTYKAVLEIYVSYHGDDEFWYSNPPTAYIENNNLTTKRGNGAFRQVVVTIDGVFVGSAEPFPVIFTGGINPLFWEPIVAIGAFDLPSYNVDLTPFLELLLDGKSHSFGLGVTNSIPFWLVDANLHLWLDPNSPVVTAKSVIFKTPALSLQKKLNFDGLNGRFKIEAERELEFSGWVVSSAGNFTTHVSYDFKFKNSIMYKENGKSKEVEQKIKSRTVVKVLTDARILVSQTKLKHKFPLNIKMFTLPGSQINTYLSLTNVSHTSYVRTSLKLPTCEFSMAVTNSQVCGGWMVVQDHSVLAGTASTNQTLSYRDDCSRYSFNIAAKDGKILEHSWPTSNPVS